MGKIASDRMQKLEDVGFVFEVRQAQNASKDFSGVVLHDSSEDFSGEVLHDSSEEVSGMVLPGRLLA